MADANYYKALDSWNRGVGDFPTFQQAVAASLEALRKDFPRMAEKDLAPRVKTRADMPRPTFTEALEGRGIVEAKAVKSWQTKRRAELKAPRHSGLFPKRKLAEDQSSPELTARYVREFCTLNNLKCEAAA